MIDLFPKRPLPLSPGGEPTIDKITGIIRSVPNRKAAGPDYLPAELLKLDHPEFTLCFHSILVNVWKTCDVSQRWKDETIKLFHKKEGSY